VDCFEEMEPKLPASAYVPLLLPLLEDEHRYVRQAVIWALGTAEDPALRLVLSTFLDEDADIRCTAQSALEMMA
jgi:HEAT repeat protein